MHPQAPARERRAASRFAGANACWSHATFQDHVFLIPVAAPFPDSPSRACRSARAIPSPFSDADHRWAFLCSFDTSRNESRWRAVWFPTSGRWPEYATNSLVSRRDTEPSDFGREPRNGCNVALPDSKETAMGLAEYMIISKPDGWTVLHDGTAQNDYGTKEAAFEAAVAAASLAIRQGHEVRVSVPGNDSGNKTALGAKDPQ